MQRAVSRGRRAARPFPRTRRGCASCPPSPHCLPPAPHNHQPESTRCFSQVKENRIVNKLISKTYFKRCPRSNFPIGSVVAQVSAGIWGLRGAGRGTLWGAQMAESMWARRGDTVGGLLWFPAPGQPEGPLTWGRGARSRACGGQRDRAVVCSVMACHTFSSEALSS